MIERYLHSSKQLKAVFLLIDIRHEPSANDKMMYELGDRTGVPAGHHRDQAGQDQAQSGSEARQDAEDRTGPCARNKGDPFLLSDETGERRDMGTDRIRMFWHEWRGTGWKIDALTGRWL